MVYITSRHLGPMALGIILLAEILPNLFSPMLGVLADRVDRRALMLACEVGQSAIMLMLAITDVSYGVLLGAVFLRSMLSTTLRPALSSAIPAIVDEPRLDRANALLRAGEEGAGVLGPSIAAFAVAFVGVRGLFALDAATFLLAVPLLRCVPKLPPPESIGLKESMLQSALGGIRVLRSHAVAGRVAVGLFFFVSFAAIENVARPFLATGSLNAGSPGIGFLHAAPQLGIILGFLLVARIGLRGKALQGVIGGMLLCSLGSFLTAHASILPLALLAQFASGIGNGLAVASIDTLLQRSIPAGSLGRVFSNVYGAANIAAGVAYVVSGPLLSVVSPRGLFVVSGLGGLGAAVLTGLLIATAQRTATPSEPSTS